MACRTTERGYGNAHQRQRNAWAQLVQAGGVVWPALRLAHRAVDGLGPRPPRPRPLVADLSGAQEMQQSDGQQARAQEAPCSAIEGLVTVAAGRKTAPRAAVPPRESPTAVEGVEADLAGLPASPAGSGLAASALALARSIDDSATSPTARAACARALMVTMRELCSLVRRER